MTRHLRLILGDQLTRDIAALRDIDPTQDVVLMIEAAAEARNVPHHKQKIAFVLSAMRHFAASLQAEGVRVDYVLMDDPDNQGDLGLELARAVRRHQPARVVVTEPSEWRVSQMMQHWDIGVPLDLRDDDRFFCARAEFAALTRARKTGRLEFFYREMRRRTGILMRGDEPAGGAMEFRSRKPQGPAP